MNEYIDIPKFLAVDFYCGAGGTTRGLLDAGGYVICGIDKDEDNRATCQRNNRNTRLCNDEPRFLAFDMLPRRPDYPQGQQHDVLDSLRELIPHHRQMVPEVPLMFVICAPCQSFTRFVQRRMTVDRTQSRDRDLNLLSQTIAFAAEFQPEMVISENVASIKTGEYRHIWNDFQKQSRTLGYAVSEDRVCAARFGVPQFRRRSVLLALRIENGRGPGLSLEVPDRDPEAPLRSAREAIDHLPPLVAGGWVDDIVQPRMSKSHGSQSLPVNVGQAWGT